MSIVLLDSHVVHWWSAEPERLSRGAARLVDRAEELAVSAITWFELAWLARKERIVVTRPIGTWLDELSGHVRTVGISPRIADTASALPTSFPGDPADRLIYATAIEHGWRLVTKDQRMLDFRSPRQVAIW